MGIPTSYLTSYKNLGDILAAIQNAQAPKKFAISFLESLGFKSTADRLIIGVLKSLGFLTASGEPTDRYYRYLDQTQSATVLGEGIRDAYGDLFQVNVKANTLDRNEVKNKLRTLTQGQFTDSVLDKMAGTFVGLVEHADFTASPQQTREVLQPPNPDAAATQPPDQKAEHHAPIRLGGLVYNIQLVLPDSRDPAVYDAFFRSLKEHLLK